MCAEMTPGRAYSRCPLIRHETVTWPYVSARYSTKTTTRMSTRPETRSCRPPARKANGEAPRGRRRVGERPVEPDHRRRARRLCGYLSRSGDGRVRVRV